MYMHVYTKKAYFYLGSFVLNYPLPLWGFSGIDTEKKIIQMEQTGTSWWFASVTEELNSAAVRLALTDYRIVQRSSRSAKLPSGLSSVHLWSQNLVEKITRNLSCFDKIKIWKIRTELVFLGILVFVVIYVMSCHEFVVFLFQFSKNTGKAFS